MSKFKIGRHKFKIGRYRISDDEARIEEIRITKITPSFITFFIKEYHGVYYSLYDVEVKRKIRTNEYGNEYIPPLYYVWNTIFTPSATKLNSDFGFDVLHLEAEDLKIFED